MCENNLIKLGYDLKKMLDKMIKVIANEYGLRNVEIEILFFLKYCNEKNTAKDIINAKYWSKAHVSKSINNLYKKNLVLLTEDDNDHRITHILLTETSEKIIEKAEKVKEEYKKIVCENIQKEKIDILNEVIIAIDKNIQKYI